MSRSGAFTPAYDARGLSARNSAPKAVTIARNNTTSHMSLGGMALRKGREGVVKEDATFAYNNVYGSLYEVRIAPDY